MSKLQKIVLFGMMGAIAILVYLEANQPKPLNWYPSYHQQDKIPLGSKVAFKLMKNKLGDRLRVMERPPYEVLTQDSVFGTYFFLNDYILFDEAELNLLLDWTAKGNTVFMATTSYSEGMLDTLQLKLNSAVLVDRMDTQPLLNLVHPKLTNPTPYHLDQDRAIRYFESIDTLSQTVLGLVDVYNDTLQITNDYINFLKIPIEKGVLYLHNQPEVFSNYFMVQGNNHEYTEKVLAYLPSEKPIYWDAYYKSGKRIQLSPLYLLLDNRNLKWAYYTVLIGLLLFVLFEGKRKQRSIPIQPKLTNKTYEYTRTIAGMYLDKKEYRAVVDKQIALFYEYIRIHLRVPTEHKNSRFVEAVAARSNNTVEDTNTLLEHLSRLQQKPDIVKEDVMTLHQHITEFKSKIDGTS
ncbi:DUF4350 domain-containing protein [Altibacter sp. HG106]|uniref:DUF4350 domain-containing protein n=1 Tax=Altibacter sp. HG106 TaxID=3023937 RepID=UPI00235100EE|nr:DUF4350 domain-containing protein [Altibacter sp. HG106]MDC7993840.1 DUF4350 domain-containing protein [Altibacter sp. HG106]